MYESFHSVIGILLMSIGCLAAFIVAFLPRALSLLLLLSGMGVLDWRYLALVILLALAFCLFIFWFYVREKSYRRNYPLFDKKPVGSFSTRTGSSTTSSSAETIGDSL
jgi:hypothetical protein